MTIKKQQKQEARLLYKHVLGLTTPRQEKEVEAWGSRSELHKIVLERLRDPVRLAEMLEWQENFDIEKEWGRMQQQIPELASLSFKRTFPEKLHWGFLTAVRYIKKAEPRWLFFSLRSRKR